MVDSLDLAFHHVTEHLVIREVVSDKGCRSVCTVSCTESIVDVAVSVRSKLLHKLLLILLHNCLCGLLLLLSRELASWLALLLCIETKVLKNETLAHLQGSNLSVSSLAVISKLHWSAEEFLYAAEDVLERELLCNSLRTSEV